jgi:hypothetical protein
MLLSMITSILPYLLCILYLPSLYGWWWFKKTPEQEHRVKQEMLVYKFTLMIHPGDSQGQREIEEIPERALTFQCAQELKSAIEARMPEVRVLLTRAAGETIEPLQAASYANRLKVDLYLSLHFYSSKEKMNKLSVYHVLYNPGTDFWQTKDQDLSLCPYNKAYRIHLKKTYEWASKIVEHLKKEEKLFLCQDLAGIPFKPLLGVTAPSIGIEMGLKKKSDYKALIPALVVALDIIMMHTEVENSHDTPIQAPPLLTPLN